MSKNKHGYQIPKIGHPSGFCWLCWKFTEERTAGVVVKICTSGERKHQRQFKPIMPLAPSSTTAAAARKLLEDYIEISNKEKSQHTLEGLIYSFIPSYNYQSFLDLGLESSEEKDRLLEEIEKEWIFREYTSRVFQLDINGFQLDINNMSFSRKFDIRPLNKHIGDFSPAPVSASNSFCRDHNPNRSKEALQNYQNHRKRISEFEKEIHRLYSDPIESRFANDSDVDLQNLLKKAFDNVVTSTLSKILKLKSEGKKQKEIAEILQTTPQAVSNALRRNKNKVLDVSFSQNSEHPPKLG